VEECERTCSSSSIARSRSATQARRDNDKTVIFSKLVAIHITAAFILPSISISESSSSAGDIFLSSLVAMVASFPCDALLCWSEFFLARPPWTNFVRRSHVGFYEAKCSQPAPSQRRSCHHTTATLCSAAAAMHYCIVYRALLLLHAP